ncbi:hypothetical protein [Desulfovibrio inopinatus]|uniref:hypothetical protein n=1 Tax=Desulfovibrio inopinatus TaxID=102109 RepID=UPI00040E69E7|nr:hypothetical protein [Desulfovibrio inopinatus]
MKKSGILACLAACVVAMVLLARFEGVNRQFPAYFTWDMDNYVFQDMALIFDGQLPDHLVHPGFGLNLGLYGSTTVWAYICDIVRPTMHVVAQALDPIVVVLVTVDFWRSLLPFLATMVVILLASGLSIGARAGPGVLALASVCIGTMPGLVVQASMLRSELFALLWFAAGFLALAQAAVCHRRWRYVWLLGAGGCAGLAYLTKIQCLFYILSMILFYALFCDGMSDDVERTDRAEPSDFSPGLFVCGLIHLIVFVTLWGIGAMTQMPENVVNFAAPALVTPPFLLFIFITISGLLLASGAVHWLVRRSPFLERVFFSTEGTFAFLLDKRCVAALVLLPAGFTAAFGLHFFLYTNPATAWAYLLADFSTLFVHRSQFEALFLFTFAEKFKVSAIPFAYGSAAILVAWSLSRRPGGGRTWRGLVVSACIGGVFFVSAMLAVRSLRGDLMLRDYIWAETGFLLLLVYFGARGIASSSSAGRWLGALAFCAVIAVNLFSGRNMVERVYAEQSDYGFRLERFFRRGYDGNHKQFERIMRERYLAADTVPVVERAATVARDWKDVRFLFPTLSVSPERLGIAVPGGRLAYNDPTVRIDTLSSELTGALIFDPTGLPVHGGPRFRFQFAFEGWAFYQQHARQKGDPVSVVVVPRPDRRVYLLSRMDRIHDFDEMSGLSSEAGPSMTVRTGTGQVEYTSRCVQAYTEIPVALLHQDVFFLVTEKAQTPNFYSWVFERQMPH